MRPLPAALFAVCIAFSACQSGGPLGGGRGGDELESLAAAMVGSYSSAEQAADDPEFRDIHLEMVRIWPDRDDGPWLYVEQAAAGSLDRPYRQRVYRLVRSVRLEQDPDTIESRVFELPGDPLAFAGAWREAKPLDGLAPEDLHSLDGCTVFLHLVEPGTWVGGTNASDCGNTFRGASYATSEVQITDTELRSWDRGFNAEGNQVWGAVKGAYVFRKEEVVEAPRETMPMAR